MGETHFLGQNWAKKSKKSLSPKTVGSRKLVDPQNGRNIWFTICVLRYVYPLDDWKCPKHTILGGGGVLIMMKLYGFPYVVKHLLYKVGWPLEMIARMDLLWAFWYMYSSQTTGSAQKSPFLFFLSVIWWNFKIFQVTKAIQQIKLTDISKWLKEQSFY